jgi:hypothetical protein
MIWSSRERNRSCSPLSRRSRGRIANPPLHPFERDRITPCDSTESQKQICKEMATKRPKPCKFDYLIAANHPAYSKDSEFFTDHDLSTGTLIRGVPQSISDRQHERFRAPEQLPAGCCLGDNAARSSWGDHPSRSDGCSTAKRPLFD